MILMRSISSKLILAFLIIVIASVAILFTTARSNTRVEFIKFLSDQTQRDLIADLSIYHLENGSWAGVERIFFLSESSRQPGFGPIPESDDKQMVPFTLADENGNVIISSERYKVGDRVPESAIALGVPITEEGKVIGILLPMRVPFEGKPREVEFIETTNRTLLDGALLAALIALFLGIFFSRTLTRPIRELTRATHAVSNGDLSQHVPIRSNDELGELAKAFNKMSAELSRSVNARKQMTADIAHELRTPLSLILGHAEAVHDGVLPPTRENFEIIREEATRLENLVNDLRTLSLADAGELSIQLQTIEPQRLLNEVSSLYQYQAQRKNISFELDIAPNLPSIEVDPGRITQVLTNILDNALRHTPEGGRVIFAAKEVADQIELSVQDSGPGLSIDDVNRIFERFYRTDSSRQREEGGSGLGLAIAKSIVQAHGGQLLAESEAGEGLNVKIVLPKKIH
jgi:two-component system sensor histidine kinase BaeS